jgi:hypothetical protein
MRDSELVTENEDLKLECRTAAERSQQGREQCGQHDGGREPAEGAQLPIYQPDPNLREPRMARGAAIKHELSTSSGGGLTSSQVSGAPGITRQAVDNRRSRRALLAVPNGSGDYVYPACQFTSDGVIPGLEKVLRAFQTRSSWTQLSVLLASAPALWDKTILGALNSGAIERAIAIAASFGEQAA